MLRSWSKPAGRGGCAAQRALSIDIKSGVLLRAALQNPLKSTENGRVAPIHEATPPPLISP
jgi:hypothetical protein